VGKFGLVQREEHGVKMFGNWVLKKIFGPQGKEMTEY
jgi:hypothetical protein